MPRIRLPKPCIKCGATTSTPNYVCRNCSSIDLSKVPLEIWHEFIGLFFGEGSISIRIVHHPSRDNLYITLAISLREDDRHALDFLNDYLGGTISIDNHSESPQARWAIQKTKDIEVILQKIVETSLIPAKKLQDVKLALEFISWKNSIPFRNANLDKGFELRSKLMASRSYGAIRG